MVGLKSQNPGQASVRSPCRNRWGRRKCAVLQEVLSEAEDLVRPDCLSRSIRTRFATDPAKEDLSIAPIRGVPSVPKRRHQSESHRDGRRSAIEFRLLSHQRRPRRSDQKLSWTCLQRSPAGFPYVCRRSGALFHRRRFCFSAPRSRLPARAVASKRSVMDHDGAASDAHERLGRIFCRRGIHREAACSMYQLCPHPDL